MEEEKTTGLDSSQARKIQQLIQIHKGLIKRKQKLADFKEPVLFLIRRNQTIDFFESATKGTFVFKHTDGDIRKIDVTPSKLMSFPFADRKVRCYICHEDFPLPLPEEPLVSSELVRISQEKSMHDINKYKLEELKTQQGNWKVIGWVIGGVALAIALAIVVVPDAWWDRVFKTGAYAVQKQTAETAQQPEQPILNILWLSILFTRNWIKCKTSKN